MPQIPTPDVNQVVKDLKSNPKYSHMSEAEIRAQVMRHAATQNVKVDQDEGRESRIRSGVELLAKGMWRTGFGASPGGIPKELMGEFSPTEAAITAASYPVGRFLGSARRPITSGLIRLGAMAGVGAGAAALTGEDPAMGAGTGATAGALGEAFGAILGRVMAYATRLRPEHVVAGLVKDAPVLAPLAKKGAIPAQTLEDIVLKGPRVAGDAIQRVEDRVVQSLGGPHATISSQVLGQLDRQTPQPRIPGVSPGALASHGVAPNSRMVTVKEAFDELKRLKIEEPQVAKLLEDELFSFNVNAQLENEYRAALGQYRKAMNAVRLVSAWTQGRTRTMADIPIALDKVLHRRVGDTPKPMWTPDEMPHTMRAVTGYEEAIANLAPEKGGHSFYGRMLNLGPFAVGTPVQVGRERLHPGIETRAIRARRTTLPHLRGIAEVVGAGTAGYVIE